MRTSFSEGPSAAWRYSAYTVKRVSCYTYALFRLTFSVLLAKEAVSASAGGAQGRASLASLTGGPLPSRQPSCPLRPSPPSQSRGCRRRSRMPCGAWTRLSRALQFPTASQTVSLQEAATGIVEAIKPEVGPHRKSSHVGVEQPSEQSQAGQSHRIAQVGTPPPRIAGSFVECGYSGRMRSHVALLKGDLRSLATSSRRLARVQACPNSAKLVQGDLGARQE